jgi:hypothetical protein
MTVSAHVTTLRAALPAVGAGPGRLLGTEDQPTGSSNARLELTSLDVAYSAGLAAGARVVQPSLARFLR